MRLLVAFITLQMFCFHADTMERSCFINSTIQQSKKRESPLITKVRSICKKQLKDIKSEDIKKLIEAKVLCVLSYDRQVLYTSWINCNVYMANVVVQNSGIVFMDVDKQVMECLRCIAEHETEPNDKKKIKDAIDRWLLSKNRSLMK